MTVVKNKLPGSLYFWDRIRAEIRYSTKVRVIGTTGQWNSSSAVHRVMSTLRDHAELSDPGNSRYSS